MLFFLPSWGKLTAKSAWWQGGTINAGSAAEDFVQDGNASHHF
jgi:hypothetical protein